MRERKQKSANNVVVALAVALAGILIFQIQTTAQISPCAQCSVTWDNCRMGAFYAYDDCLNTPDFDPATCNDLYQWALTICDMDYVYCQSAQCGPGGGGGGGVERDPQCMAQVEVYYQQCLAGNPLDSYGAYSQCISEGGTVEACCQVERSFHVAQCPVIVRPK
jgi:hypothetical protein